MRIDREQHNTGNCHQNADLQKDEQVLLKAGRSGQCGFVDAQYQTDAAARERPGHRAFVSLWELSAQTTPVDKGALHHVERCDVDNVPPQLLPENKQMFSKHTQISPSQPLPSIVCYRRKAFTKGGHGQDLPLRDHHLH